MARLAFLAGNEFCQKSTVNPLLSPKRDRGLIKEEWAYLMEKRQWYQFSIKN